jgi:hypothetical protein
MWWRAIIAGLVVAAFPPHTEPVFMRESHPLSILTTAVLLAASNPLNVNCPLQHLGQRFFAIVFHGLTSGRVNIFSSVSPDDSNNEGLSTQTQPAP